MRCPHCGNEHPVGALFCPVTGQSLRLEWPIARRRDSPAWWIVISLGLLLIAVGFFVLRSRRLLPDSNPIVAVGSDDSSNEARTPAGSSATATGLVPVSVVSGETPTVTSNPALLPLASPAQTLEPPRTPGPAPSATNTATAVRTISLLTYAYGENEQREIFVLNLATGERIQITHNIYQDEAPSFSPDNRRIVYTSYRSASGGWELYVFDLDTNSEEKITDFSGQARFPEWSPAAGDSRIAFEGREGSSSTMRNIWVVEFGTDRMVRLTTHGADGRPTWSPDGSRIAFGRALNDNTGDGLVTTADRMDIYLVDPLSLVETRVTSTPGIDEFQFAFSPEGGRILFASVRTDANGDGDLNLDDTRDLYTISVDGLNETRIDLGGLAPFSPDWAHTDPWIVVTANIAPGLNQIWLYDPGTFELTQLTESGPFYHAAFSR